MSQTDKKSTPLTEEQLLQKEKDLNLREEGLNKKEKDLNLREEGLNKKEKDLQELEKSLLESETVEVAEPERGHEFSHEKENFKFKDSSPKNFRIGGKRLSQKEIAKDKEILAKMINGPHIEKIK